MLNYPDFLAGWVAGWLVDRDSSVSLELLAGPPGVDKRSMSVAAESSQKLGSITVWEGGESEGEILALSTEERIWVSSLLLDGPVDLQDLLSKFVRMMDV